MRNIKGQFRIKKTQHTVRKRKLRCVDLSRTRRGSKRSLSSSDVLTHHGGLEERLLRAEDRDVARVGEDCSSLDKEDPRENRRLHEAVD